MIPNQGQLRFPPLNTLRMFECAGRCLSFRAAAEELGLTHSAVAQQIRALERALNIKLFHRLPRSLALTEAGRTYHASIQRALKLIVSATEDLRPARTIVTISVTTSFAAKWLIPRLNAFTDAHPDIEVQVLATTQLANFHSDGVDIAVRQGRSPSGLGLRVDLLFPLRVTPVCSPRLIADSHPIAAVNDLSGHVLIHDAHGLWPAFLQNFTGDFDLSSCKALKLSHESLAIDAAISAQGVALASEPLVAEDIRCGRLIQPLPMMLETEVGYYVVTARVPREPGPVRRMRDWLLGNAATG